VTCSAAEDRADRWSDFDLAFGVTDPNELGAVLTDFIGELNLRQWNPAQSPNLSGLANQNQCAHAVSANSYILYSYYPPSNDPSFNFNSLSGPPPLSWFP
ncbi:MAG: hypothetical protein ABIQ44_04355, partial [Chloroflexia bacterium]